MANGLWRYKVEYIDLTLQVKKTNRVYKMAEAQLKKDREEAIKSGKITTKKVRKKVPVQKTEHSDKDNQK